MPRILPANVGALPCLFYKEEGSLQISIKDEVIGDCDYLVRTKYGTRKMDSLKLFIEYDDKIISSKSATILDTPKSKYHFSFKNAKSFSFKSAKNFPFKDAKNFVLKHAKYFAFKETFTFATPPTLEGGLPSFTLGLKHAGSMRASDSEKTNYFVQGLRSINKFNRDPQKLISLGTKAANTYRIVIGRSTKQSIDTKALMSAEGYEMDIPVKIHAREDMGLFSLKLKKNSRYVQTTVHIKWTPPLSASPQPTCTLSPLGVLDENPPNPISIQSNLDPKAVYKPISGNTIFQAEGLDTTLDLIESNYYEKDDLGPRQLSAIDAPPVKKVMAVYGINLPTQVSSICCRRPISRSGPRTKISSEFILDQSTCLVGFNNTNSYVNDNGQIKETSKTLQKDLLTGEYVHKSGDGTVPYYSLQQCQVWKKEGSCDVQIEEIDGAEHRSILADERFHNFLLSYVMG